MPKLIDSHAHIQFPAYSEDREAVISRALDAGIWMVNIGTQESTSRDAIQLAERYPEGVYAAIGFHPGHIEPSHHDEWEKEKLTEEVFDVEQLRKLAHHPKVVGIGECGLDYYRIKNQEVRIKEKQKEIFRAQIELARESGKPLIIHCREAFDDLIEILNSYFLISTSRPNGVVHFFSGTLDNARKLIEMGFYLGFGGVITFAKMYKNVVQEAPLGWILLETDAPYVAPVPYRGKRNEPLYLEAVAARIAEWKGLTIDQVARTATENAKTLFQIGITAGG